MGHTTVLPKRLTRRQRKFSFDYGKVYAAAEWTLEDEKDPKFTSYSRQLQTENEFLASQWAIKYIREKYPQIESVAGSMLLKWLSTYIVINAKKEHIADVHYMYSKRLGVSPI